MTEFKIYKETAKHYLKLAGKDQKNNLNNTPENRMSRKSEASKKEKVIKKDLISEVGKSYQPNTTLCMPSQKSLLIYSEGSKKDPNVDHSPEISETLQLTCSCKNPCLF